MPVTDHHFQSKDRTIGYKLFVPNNYAKQTDAAYPLILFLHGIKMRGDDLQLLEDYGLIRVAKEAANFPYVVVAPQCPANTQWPDHRDRLLGLIEEIVRHYSIDRDRIYLTGFSMGGEGTWDLAAATENVFAAAAPIAGGYNPEAAASLTRIPIWAFHGEQDDVVPITDTIAIINAIKEIGGNPRFTVYPTMDHGHIVMFETYANPELYAWFERNHRKRHFHQ